jgi:hypothetical protein
MVGGERWGDFKTGLPRFCFCVTSVAEGLKFCSIAERWDHPSKSRKKLLKETRYRGYARTENKYVIVLAPVRGNLGGVIESCLARVKQYVQSVERQRDIMPVGKQELFDFIVCGAVRGLHGHDHRTVHHHVNIRCEAEKKKNKEGRAQWDRCRSHLVKQSGFAGT